MSAEIHRLHAEVLQIRGAPALEIEGHLHSALDIARRQGAKWFELRAATSLARLWRDYGRCDEAHDLLAPVYGWFTEGRHTPDLSDARALLDELAVGRRCEQRTRLGPGTPEHEL
jgi:predicted ATPase